MVKFMPFDAVRIESSEPEQETAEGLAPEVCDVDEEVAVLVVEVDVIVLLPSQLGFSYTVKLLPPPHRSVGSLAQSSLHSPSSVRTAPVPKLLPQ